LFETAYFKFLAEKVNMAIESDNAKQHLITILQQQPDDSSYDELLKELAFARMIDRGLRDAAAGRTSSNKDVQDEIAAWRNQK
jgi:hypothetical protein